MQLQELLIENKGEILDGWVDQVLATYPEDAARIFKKGKDKFANPVGQIVQQALWNIYVLLFEKDDPPKIVEPLEHLVQVRAVQTFSPSEAVGMAYILKKVVKAQCDKEKVDDQAGWFAFDEKVDILAYTLFDLFMQCRERLYQVRLAEIKSGNNIMTDGGCPSKLMKDNKADKAELKTINI